MPWPAISRNEDKGLARYAVDELAQEVPLPIARQDALATPDGRRRVVEAIYDALSQRDISYALEPYGADVRVQQIRPPETVLGGAREGTCLDLALLFAGITLGKELAPLLVMLDGHALIAVSLDDDRRTAADPPRRNREGPWLEEGVLRDGDILRHLIDDGHYLAVECTGFAASGVLPPDVPEGVGRINGKLTFGVAVEAGRSQLDCAARPFRFAIDLAVLRDANAFFAYDSPLGAALSPFRRRLERLMEDERFFGGRDDELAWLDRAIVADTGGYAFVTGLSGSGKTALLVNWVRALLARTPSPGRVLRVAYTFISQKYEIADEQSTLQLLCQQLLRVRQRAEPLPDNVPALEEKYIELLTEPTMPGTELVVVIDGLDEVAGWTPSRVLFPRMLPERVHLVFSAREIAQYDWLKLLDLDEAPTLRLSSLDRAAVASLLRTMPEPLAAKSEEPAFVAELHRVSAGDPFYLRFLIADLAELSAPSVGDVRAKPSRLGDYLDAWWTDVAAKGKVEKSVRDLLCYLVVANGALSRDELADIASDDDLDSFTVDDAITAVRRYIVGNDATGYTLCHPRFRDYLVGGRVRPADQRRYLDHLVAWCLGAWRGQDARYAVQHAIAHLSGKRLLAPPEERSGVTAQMLALATDPAFRERKLATPLSLLDYQRDLQEVLGAAISDVWPAAISAIVETALGLVELRLSAPGVAMVFEAARNGTPERGLAQLAAVAPDDDWFRASLLVCAWLCAVRDPNKAATFRAAQAEVLQPETLYGALTLLDNRLAAAITRQPEPPLQLPFYPGTVPQNVSAEMARAIVARIGGGASDDEAVAAHLNPSMIGSLADRAEHGDETPTYIAEGDAPWLIGFAMCEPAEGESLIRRYLAVHAENPYAVYRNRSLWAVLGAVVCLDKPHLAAELAGTICEAALNPAAVDYREMLRLAALGVGAGIAPATGAEQIEAFIVEARSAAANLNPVRSEADTWGHHCRRFAALSEVIALIGGEPGHIQSLLEAALQLPFGYAGYQAPASIALADANFVCGRGPAAVDSALAGAVRAAHNVQESRFCAFTTARVNAIVRRWRPGCIADLSDTIARFAADPFAVEFSALHIVGEQYCQRSKGSNALPIPPESRAARSLQDIAADVYGVSLARFQGVNSGIDAGAALKQGSKIDLTYLPAQEPPNHIGEVNVPDAGFAPILAARFAAEILGRRAELAGQPAELIARLVPVAAANATALDAVLARLLLAARPLAAPVTQRILNLAPADWLKSPVPNPRVPA